MARRKVKLAYITSDSKRRATFRKRKNGLIKKVDEISTLCGIEACAIIFNQNDPQPEVWPSEIEAQSVLARFRTMHQLDQSKNMLDQESFLKQRILKAQQQLKKQRDDNRKNKVSILLHQSLQDRKVVGDVSATDLNDMMLLIDEKLKEVEQRMKLMTSQEEVQNINGAQTIMSTIGEQTNGGHVQGMEMGVEQPNMGHVQGLENNMDDMHIDQFWSMNFTNNNDGVLPFGDVSVPNGALGLIHNSLEK